MASRGQVAPVEMRRAVAKCINKSGIVEAARVIGIARETLAKVAGGVAVTPGTIALVRERLQKAS